MKLLLLVLCISTQVYAKAFFPVGKAGANTNYWDKSVCEAKEGVTCYDLDLCPLDECVKSGNALVVDPDKKATKDATVAAEVAAEMKKKADAAALESDLKTKLAKKNKSNAELEEIIDLLAKKLGL